MRPMSEPADPESTIREALAELDEHLSQPERAQADLAASGRRLRAVSIFFCALTSVSFAAAIHARLASHPSWPLAVMATVFTTILAVALVLFDVSIAPRGQPTAPDVALRSYFRALATARAGYAWAALAPRARAQTVRVPALGDVAVTAGEHAMSSPASIAEHLRCFARSRGWHSRNVLVRHVGVADVAGDVARVEAVLVFQSWPRWIGWLTLVLALPVRHVVWIGILLYLVMRKQFEVRVTKTLIRGRNGAWYVLDADILEGATAG